MTKFYRSNKTGNLYPESAIENAVKVFDLNITDVMSDFTEVFPTVIDVLRSGSTVYAVFRYRDIHGCSLKEAKDMVEKIKKTMERISKK